MRSRRFLRERPDDRGEVLEGELSREGLGERPDTQAEHSGCVVARQHSGADERAAGGDRLASIDRRSPISRGESLLALSDRDEDPTARAVSRAAVAPAIIQRQSYHYRITCDECYAVVRDEPGLASCSSSRAARRAAEIARRPGRQHERRVTAVERHRDAVQALGEPWSSIA
jgi:hypothetical protein